jgi:polyisoprenoid-binding protein YceI
MFKKSLCAIRESAAAPTQFISPLKAIAAAAASALVMCCAPVRATTYTLEPDYTQGVFRWNHLGFSSPAAQFAQGTGTLEFDPANPTAASVVVTIPLVTLNTGVPGLDEHFRSSDFFDTARYPTATFKSTRVEKGAGMAKTAMGQPAMARPVMGQPVMGQLQVTGDLSLHGVTKPVTLDVTLIKVGTNPRSDVPTVGFDAMTILKRSDFGLGKYVPQVGDEIEMHITVQAADAVAYAQFLKKQAEEEATAEAARAKATKAEAAKKQGAAPK